MSQDIVHIKLFIGVKELEEFTEDKSAWGSIENNYTNWCMKSWCRRSLGAENSLENCYKVYLLSNILRNSLTWCILSMNYHNVEHSVNSLTEEETQVSFVYRRELWQIWLRLNKTILAKADGSPQPYYRLIKFLLIIQNYLFSKLMMEEGDQL